MVVARAPRLHESHGRPARDCSPFGTSGEAPAPLPSMHAGPTTTPNTPCDQSPLTSHKSPPKTTSSRLVLFFPLRDEFFAACAVAVFDVAALAEDERALVVGEDGDFFAVVIVDGRGL